MSFALSSLLAGLFFSGRQDLIIAYSPPLFAGMSGYIISRVKRIPFVFEVGDLWPDFAIELGVLTNRVLIKLSYWLEGLVYRKADRISVVTSVFKETLSRKNKLLADKVVVIPNGADLDIFRPADKHNWVRKEYGWNNKFVIMYTGAHGISHNLIQLVEVARELEEYEDILFVLIGDGMQKPTLKKKVKEYGLTNLQFLDTQPRYKIIDFINAADVCTAVLKKVNTFKMVHPGKIFDYMSCAKPIITAINGAARKLIEKANAGIYVEPENIREFKEAVLKFYNDRNLYNEYGESGYAYVRENFSRKNLAYQYEKILERLVKNAKVPKAAD